MYISYFVLLLTTLIVAGNLIYTLYTGNKDYLDCENETDCRIVSSMIALMTLGGFFTVMGFIVHMFKFSLPKQLVILVAFLTLGAGVALIVTNALYGPLGGIQLEQMAWIINFAAGGLGSIGGGLALF